MAIVIIAFRAAILVNANTTREITMSNAQFKPIKPPSDGILFGNVSTNSQNTLSVFVRSEASPLACILVHGFHTDVLVRLKPSELREFRDTINRAIKHFDEKDKPDFDPGKCTCQTMNHPPCGYCGDGEYKAP